MRNRFGRKVFEDKWINFILCRHFITLYSYLIMKVLIEVLKLKIQNNSLFFTSIVNHIL